MSGRMEVAILEAVSAPRPPGETAEDVRTWNAGRGRVARVIGGIMVFLSGAPSALSFVKFKCWSD